MFLLFALAEEVKVVIVAGIVVEEIEDVGAFFIVVVGDVGKVEFVDGVAVGAVVAEVEVVVAVVVEVLEAFIVVFVVVVVEED